MTALVTRLQDISMADLPRVGGKNASLGEMIRHLGAHGIRVPDGFATTTDAYRAFLGQDGLDATIRSLLHGVDVSDIEVLTQRGATIREAILSTPLPASLQDAVAKAWHALCAGAQVSFAVRSSLTTEDLPHASFAGQQDTLLNVAGLSELMSAIHEVYVSAYNDRAIAYRAHHRLDHAHVAVSVGIQRMVRSDLAAAGVVITLETESGFRDLVLITSAYGLGESVVQGSVNPDEFYVFKPTLRAGKDAIVRRNLGSKATKLVYGRGDGQRIQSVDVEHADRRRFSLTDADVVEIARQALIIEDHYRQPMDIEWARDGVSGQLFIVQARPETIGSRPAQGTVRFSLRERGRVLARGRSVGQRASSGTARVVNDASEMRLLQRGDVLVTDMTDPDWEPVLKRVAAIVTDRGGRTSHAAITARELGIPAVVGCGDATASILDGSDVTVSCAEGDEGIVYAGRLDYELQEFRVNKLPALPIKLMMNVSNPDRAFSFAATPNDGVGRARIEFMVDRMVGVHPLALLNYAGQDASVKHAIDEHMAGYADPVAFFVAKLSEGVASVAAAFFPKPVIVQLSDFQSSEYAALVGGRRYEPDEQNPMLGLRGAARYLDDEFRECFDLECRALKHVRDEMGLHNVQIMVPFVRTVKEAERVIGALEANGLKRGDNGLEIVMLCAIPSNVLLADAFLGHFDGMAIGSSDLAQLVLGIDRDSAKMSATFDDRDAAVKAAFELVIAACRRTGKSVGICSDDFAGHPDLARWLLERGMTYLSLNPESLVDTWLYLAKR